MIYRQFDDEIMDYLKKTAMNNELKHYAKGSEAKEHKYVSKHRSKSGKMVYVYKDSKHEREVSDQLDQRIGLTDDPWSGMFDRSVYREKVLNPTAQLEATDDPKQQQVLQKKIDAGIKYIQEIEAYNKKMYESGSKKYRVR